MYSLPLASRQNLMFYTTVGPTKKTHNDDIILRPPFISTSCQNCVTRSKSVIGVILLFQVARIRQPPYDAVV